MAMVWANPNTIFSYTTLLRSALDLGDGIAGADGKGVVGFGSGGGAEFQLQLLTVDAVLGQNVGPPDHVAQLAHIAGPVIAQQFVERLLGKVFADPVLGIELMEKALGQQQHVLPSDRKSVV